MSDRTDGGDVAAQQDHRQGLDGGYERQETRYRSLDVEAVVPCSKTTATGRPVAGFRI